MATSRSTSSRPGSASASRPGSASAKRSASPAPAAGAESATTTTTTVNSEATINNNEGAITSRSESASTVGAPCITTITSKEPTPGFRDPDFVGELLKCKSSEATELIAVAVNAKDYNMNLRNCILVEFYLNDLEFCKELSFSVRKTQTFLCFCEELLKMIIEDGGEIRNVLQHFRNKILAYSRPKPPVLDNLSIPTLNISLIRSRSGSSLSSIAGSSSTNGDQQQQQGDGATPASASSAATNAKSNASASSAAGQGNKKLSKKEMEQNAREEEARQKEEAERREREAQEQMRKKQEEEEMKKLPVYNVDDVKAITDFVVNSIFQHARLYHYVFTEEGEKDVHRYKVLLQVPAAPESLKSAMKEEEYIEVQRKKEEEAARLKAEEEERKRLEEQKAREEEQKRKEEEERKAKEEEEKRKKEKPPQLSSKELEDVAKYLGYQLNMDIEQRQKLLLKRIEAIEGKLK